MTKNLSKKKRAAALALAAVQTTLLQQHREPLVRVHLDPDEIIADNFAGGGGASSGIEWALGRSPDIAVNHDAEAIAMHRANHPSTRHYLESVWEVDPIEACAGRPVGLAWFSPDCFPAGTLVLTHRGYEPIESIEVGDYVLTHRGRWRRVTETSSTRRSLVRLRGHGHPGLMVSPEHPFYARTSKRGTPDWITAGCLDNGCYWATPVEFPASEPPPVPKYRARGMTITAELMWLAGRYIADGWTRLTATRGELVIICGRVEADSLREKLERWTKTSGRAGTDELTWTSREVVSDNDHGSVQFSTNHRGLVEWLREHFGHGSEWKHVPSWALGMDRELREALLAGYVSGDAWLSRRWSKASGFVETSTVSKALAFSAKALAASLGHTVAVYINEDNTNVIDGRTVNTRAIYRLRWRMKIADGHSQTVRDGHLEFTPIREREDEIEDDVQVFNIGVDEDESYIVEGIVVHNCKHFSKAKGSTPRSQKVRGLAWSAIRWAQLVRPRVICLENVEEFKDWGPVDKVTGLPRKDKKGATFRAFVKKLQRLGYTVEWRLLKACDFGAPTSRRRFFMIARCDGGAIVWPEPTHGDGRQYPFRTAADCIDWSIAVPSIFDRKKPLAAKTEARIARGLRKFVLEAGRPFIVPVNHGSKNGVLDGRSHSIDEPLKVITSHGRGSHALVVPYMVHRSNGERPAKVKPDGTIAAAQEPRIYDIKKPMGTVMAQGQKHALVTAFLCKHNGGNNDRNGNMSGQSLDKPTDTVTSRDSKAITVAHLVRYNGTGEAEPVTKPLGTLTTRDRYGLVSAFLMKYYGTSTGTAITEPVPTIAAGSRKKKGQGTGGHHALVTVTIDGEQYAVVDIGMRMLSPRELFAAQGFSPEYDIEARGSRDGEPLTKTAQVKMCGNSVPPPVTAAIVRALFAEKPAQMPTRETLDNLVAAPVATKRCDCDHCNPSRWMQQELVA